MNDEQTSRNSTDGDYERPRRFKLYRDRLNGKFLGVCTGIANFLNFDAWIIRVLWISMTIFWSWIMIPAYFIMYFIMDERPPEASMDRGDDLNDSKHRRGIRRTASSTSRSEYDELGSNHYRVGIVKRDIVRMEKKLSRLEAYMTSNRYELDREFRSLDA